MAAGAGLFSGRVGVAATGENRVSLRQITATMGGTPGLGVPMLDAGDNGASLLAVAGVRPGEEKGPFPQVAGERGRGLEC